MKIIVTGGTGFIGRALVRALLECGDQVVVLSRNAAAAQKALGSNVEALEWHPPEVGNWAQAFNGADGVVNLAGEAVGKRWTDERKRRILSSRVDATRAVVEAIVGANPRPGVLVNGSAVGYYGSRGDAALDETSPPGSDFMSQVVVDWEAAAKPAEDLGVRVVLIRTGIVLGKDGGALPAMVAAFKMFVGGTMGRPDQWISWIHMDDEIGLILFALTHDVRGPVNATAPHPVTMDLFSREVGDAVGRPSWVPMIGKVLPLVLGELADAALASQRVLPLAAQSAGYEFRHDDSASALRSILAV